MHNWLKDAYREAGSLWALAKCLLFMAIVAVGVAILNLRQRLNHVLPQTSGGFCRMTLLFMVAGMSAFILGDLLLALVLFFLSALAGVIAASYVLLSAIPHDQRRPGAIT